MKTPTTNDKALPSDLQDGIDDFVLHLCKSEAELDNPHVASSLLDTIGEGYRYRYEVEVRRETAHIWKYNGQMSSVAWIVLGDGLIKSSKTPSNGAASYPIYFKRGDILKSATWKAPAKNFARGNVLTDRQFPRWHWNGWI